jgi:hypothetical protein
VAIQRHERFVSLMSPHRGRAARTAQRAFPALDLPAPGRASPPNPGNVTWNFAEYNTVPWNSPSGGGDFVSTESGADAVINQKLNTAYIWGSTARMVSDVQGWLDGPLSNSGWLLRNDSETTPTTFRAFYTREGAIEQGVPQFAPELIVSFVTPVSVPEPTAIVLLGSALVGFGVLWRR